MGFIISVSLNVVILVIKRGIVNELGNVGFLEILETVGKVLPLHLSPFSTFAFCLSIKKF